MRSIPILFIASLTACGSVKIRDVNQAEIKTVRRVAVASFSFQQPHSSLGDFSKEDGEVTKSYKDIATALKANMGWSVLGLDEMRGNAVYIKAYNDMMKGWQTNKVPSAGKLLTVPNVMDAQSLRRMKPYERDELMGALGVDALMETDVNVVFASKGITVMGIGSRYPQAYVSLRMYKKGVERPVWFDGRVEGEASNESVGKTGIWDESDVTRLGRLSAKNAFEKLNLNSQ
jgi:hypothetical protein